MITLACQEYHDHHTSSNLADWVREQAEEWGVLGVLDWLTTDRAANMRAIAQYLPDNVKGTDCTIHTLQSAVNVSETNKGFFLRVGQDQTNGCKGIFCLAGQIDSGVDENHLG